MQRFVPARSRAKQWRRQMTRNLTKWIKRLAAASGAGFFALLLVARTPGQTLPVAGDAQAAIAQDRADREAIQQRDDGIRGVREQDEAARRTAQEARQKLLQAVGDPGATR